MNSLISTHSKRYLLRLIAIYKTRIDSINFPVYTVLSISSWIWNVTHLSTGGECSSLNLKTLTCLSTMKMSIKSYISILNSKTKKDVNYFYIHHSTSLSISSKTYFTRHQIHSWSWTTEEAHKSHSEWLKEIFSCVEIKWIKLFWAKQLCLL